jgi:predicted acetyltransferase
MTIRKLTKKDQQSMKDIFHYCFYDGGDWDDETWEKYFSLLDYDGCYGYFINDELASTYVIQPFKIFIRGTLMNVGGIASVATKPQYRKQKQVSILTDHALKEMRVKNQVISILYPFKFSFYRRYGWENCVDFKWVISPPSNILHPTNFNKLEIEEIPHDKAFEITKPIREKFGKKFTIMMFEGLEHFKWHFLKKRSKLLALKENGKYVGYFITNLEKREGEWNVRLNIRDLLVDSMNARLTVFDYIKKHTDQNRDFSYPLMGDEKIIDYFDDLWEAKYSYKECGGPMFRVVDVEKAIKMLKFDSKITISFILQIDDQYAPWNTKPMKIDIANGNAIVTKNPKEEVNFETDIKAFTQLFTGYRSIFDLVEIGKVKITSDLIDGIDKVFPKQLTRLRTFF